MKSKNLLILTAMLLLTSSSVFANNQDMQIGYIKNGISFGTALAIAISYTHNKSILWAIIHGIFGWLYVIYFYFTRDKSSS